MKLKLRGQATPRRERWWLEYEPPKADYLGGQGRGAIAGNSVRKSDWDQQMIPICYKQKWNKREDMRYRFRKHGFNLDTPKWGG